MTTSSIWNAIRRSSSRAREWRGSTTTSTGVTGDLTIKGTTKAVAIEVRFKGVATDPDGDGRVGFEGTTRINRKDWGVNWNAALETGGVLVSEDVTIELDVSAVKVVA